MPSGEKILVIDDEQVILTAVSRIASSEGFNVDSDYSADSALKKLSQKEYSLILCDIMMPQMDGFTFLDELQKRKIATPVIMITGYSTVENAVKSLYKGAIDFVPKPFTFEELQSSIARGLEYGKLQQRIEEAKLKKNGGIITYTPCPPKYFRLGFISWLKLESEGVVIIGASDLFLEILKEIVKIDLMNVDDMLVQGDSIGSFYTEDDLVHQLLSPVSGRIIERNERLLDDTRLLEKDPYFDGWIYKVIPANIEYEMKYLISCATDRM